MKSVASGVPTGIRRGITKVLLPNRFRGFGSVRKIQEVRNGYPPEKVGEVTLQAVTTPNPRIRYAVIPRSSFQRILQTLLPRRMVDRIITQLLGFTQDNKPLDK